MVKRLPNFQLDAPLCVSRQAIPFLRVWVLVCFCSALLVGCSSGSSQQAQVVDRSPGSSHAKKPQPSGGKYIVQGGDTLYSIAFRFGWDWKTLAAKNNIAAPYMIRPGQVVYFGSAPASKYQPPVVFTPAAQPAASAPISTKPVYSPPAIQSSTQPRQTVAPVTAVAPLEPVQTAPAKTPVLTPVKLSATGWAWPAQGVVISKFSSNGSLNKGIDIAGELGQPVLAAQDGTVVYAGSGLRGYGELVIIKHSDVYVSAYGHNRSLLVREGQKVKAGQVIANMGSTGADRVKLHFEIRRQGKPADPLQYLPSR